MRKVFTVSETQLEALIDYHEKTESILCFIQEWVKDKNEITLIRGLSLLENCLADLYQEINRIGGDNE